MNRYSGLTWIVLVGLCGTATGCAGPTPLPTPTVAPPRPVPSPTETSAPPPPRPLPTASATPTPTFTATPAGTETPSNAAILTRLALTPSPVILNEALPNVTGLVPGRTTEAQALAALGEPGSRTKMMEMDRWYYLPPRQPKPTGLHFSKGVLQEVEFRAEDLTAEAVVRQYGPPEMVFFFPIHPGPPGPVPVTLAPLGPPYFYLVYAAAGLEFEFFCQDAKEYCPGVRRAYPVFTQTFFAPRSIADWLKRLDMADERFYLRPWTGFVD